jgi:aspartyl-tRNA(Asn)/glutamyl-tRNA(Gln) amidotransferase subunit A
MSAAVQPPITHQSIASLSDAMARKAVSSVELTQELLQRIDAHNGALNAFIIVDPQFTLAQAREADARRARGETGALLGVPIAHKDIFVTRGMPTSCGSRMLKGYMSPFDAHVISQFGQAGAVVLGKLNMDEYAMGGSNETSYFGPVKNPWHLPAVPGGSSGGSSAAVAARLAPAATGTDTGGSIRQPAAYTGICGLKPSYGLVSRYGMVAFASSFDQGGPMARSAEDVALLLDAMVSFDERDSTSLNRPPAHYAAGLRAMPQGNAKDALRGLRIGVPKEYFSAGLDAGVAACVQAALESFTQQGATIVELSLPTSNHAVAAYYVIASAEASSNLSRFDGVRYGHRAAQYGNLDDMYKKSRAEGFGAEVKRRILIGTYVLSHGYYDAYYIKAQKVRRLIADDFARAFAQCDVIMGPTAPTVAFELGAKADDPVAMYLTDIYTIPANLAGLPGMSIPCGFSANSAGVQMPVGLQIMGNYFSEGRMLQVAHAYQQVTDWHTRCPAAFAA